MNEDHPWATGDADRELAAYCRVLALSSECPPELRRLREQLLAPSR